MNLATNGFIGNKVGIFLMVIIFALVLLWRPLVHSNVTIVCGEFIREGKVRGAKVYTFEYITTEGVKYRMHESKNLFSVQSDELLQMNCIKLEYSNILNFSASVIDERVKKDR